jgi:hypothetical protein
MRTASISAAWGGNDPREARTSKPRLPCGGGRSGRSARGGEHTCGPAHARRTTASKRAPCGSRCTDMVERRPGPHEGQADVVREETGTRTARAPGGGVQARRDSGAETTSGRSFSPQGLTAPCTDLVVRVPPRHGEGAGLTHEPGGAKQAGEFLLTWTLRPRRTRERLARAKGLWPRGRSRRSRTLEGRGTMEHPWKHTIAGWGVGASALTPRPGWEGDRREATVSTGLGKAPRPGSQGGLRKRGPWWH